ncbi:MAG: hypothetical protein AMXMBFR72_38050 [Betaproteobacteria bacterium]
MPQAVRSVLAVVVGVVVAFALVAAIETAGHAVYPVPKGLDFTNREQVRAYIQALPLGALMFVLAAWTVAPFGGGAVAALIARARPLLHAAIVGAFVLAATLANLILILHPLWFAVLGVVGVCVGAFAAGKLVGARFAR